jgi:plastocyanin
MLRIGLSVAFALVATAWISGQDSKPAAGWGTIVGKVVWAKADPPPENQKAKVDPNNTDFKYCTSNGDIPDEEIVVDPKTKAVANVFVYLKKVAEEDIHPDYPKTADDVAKRDAEAFKKANDVELSAVEEAVKSGKADVAKLKADAMLDQPNCRYIPHALTVRVGQTLLVKNTETISHNVNFMGLEDGNRDNFNMPAKSIVTKKLVAEAHPINVKCNVHGWMEMRILALDHPYATVTNAKGEFVLKNVKPGSHVMVVRNADGRFIERSLKVELAADEVKTLEVKWAK